MGVSSENYFVSKATTGSTLSYPNSRLTSTEIWHGLHIIVHDGELQI